MNAQSALRILLSFLALSWMTGCAGVIRRAPAHVPASVVSESKVSTDSKSVLQPVPAGVRAPAQTERAPLTSERPVPEQPSYTTRLARMLQKNFVIVETTDTSLLVRRPGVTGSSSLFEEAIALSKLRGLLTARTALPKDIPQKTKIQNGTALIPVGKSLPAAEAAEAIALALSVDGVQRVRAVTGSK